MNMYKLKQLQQKNEWIDWILRIITRKAKKTLFSPVLLKNRTN